MKHLFFILLLISLLPSLYAQSVAKHKASEKEQQSVISDIDLLYADLWQNSREFHTADSLYSIGQSGKQLARITSSSDYFPYIEKHLNALKEKCIPLSLIFSKEIDKELSLYIAQSFLLLEKYKPYAAQWKEVLNKKPAAITPELNSARKEIFDLEVKIHLLYQQITGEVADLFNPFMF